MKLSDLRLRVKEKLEVSDEKAHAITTAVFDSIEQGLREDQDVRISGFGRFQSRPKRKGGSQGQVLFQASIGLRARVHGK